MRMIRARAAEFARLAHAGQVRKYTGEPYFNHCRSVANLVRERGGDEYMQAAAYLHDVIEDTGISADMLRVDFPPAVVDLVIGLTDVYTTEAYPTWNRKRRKATECHRYSQECEKVQMIKLCDLIDNTSDIVRNDPKFALTYLPEKIELLKAFRPSVLMQVPIHG